MKIVFFTLGMFLGSCLFVFSQNYTTLQTRLHYGFIMPHTPIMMHLVDQRRLGVVQIEYNTQTDGSKWWHQDLKRPRVGFSALFASLNNKQYLGYAYSGIYHIDLPIVQNEKTVFSGRLGAGLAYLNKRFDVHKNPKNDAIATHINSTISGNLTVHHQLSESWFLEGGIAFTHFSNGLFRSPNLGLNLVTSQLAIGKKINPPITVKDLSTTTAEKDKKWRFHTDIHIAGKSIYPGDKRIFGAYNVNVQTSKHLSRLSRIAFGAEWFRDNTIILECKRQKLFPGREATIAQQVGVFVGHELMISKIGILFRVGTYVHDEWKKNGPIYQKYGLKYEFSKHFYACLQVKSHYASADYALLGIGVKL